MHRRLRYLFFLFCLTKISCEQVRNSDTGFSGMKLLGESIQRTSLINIDCPDELKLGGEKTMYFMSENSVEYDGALVNCQIYLGPDARLASIDSEERLSLVSEFLTNHSFHDNTTTSYWINGETKNGSNLISHTNYDQPPVAAASDCKGIKSTCGLYQSTTVTDTVVATGLATATTVFATTARVTTWIDGSCKQSDGQACICDVSPGNTYTGACVGDNGSNSGFGLTLTWTPSGTPTYAAESEVRAYASICQC